MSKAGRRAQGSALRKTLVLFLMLCPSICFGYSFLTHEQLIDLAWEPSIKPLLLARFPHTTPAQLRDAHAYAYGGSAIQDAGYYPFGHGFFSDLTHYVRTGDFISIMIHDARDADELAFALGALSHYLGDTIGHSDAVNPSTAIEFPNLGKKFGPVVTYDESPHAHVRTEFAFDIDQLSQARFTPAAYLRHVGLKIPLRLLDQAFYETYGLHLNKVLGKVEPAMKSYRSSLRSFLPRFAYAEVLLHKKNFASDPDSPEFEKFAARLKLASVENNWEIYRQHKPSFETRMVAALIFILPKVGPLSYLSIRGPNPETELKYVTSVNRVIDIYAKLLDQLRQTGQDGFHVDNYDLDTGNIIEPGTYPRTDKTYTQLLGRIANDPNPHIPRDLKQNVLDFYADPYTPITTKKDTRKWEKVQKELTALQESVSKSQMMSSK